MSCDVAGEMQWKMKSAEKVVRQRYSAVTVGIETMRSRGDSTGANVPAWKVRYKLNLSKITDVLKIRPEDIASQITLIDIPLFRAITSQELLRGAWTKKSKHVDASNIVAFTDRFNSICLWCQREILSRERAAKRAEVLGHFIRVAKHLYDLNNLNSTFSIVSALQSLSIYRLAKTWKLIGRSEHGVLTKLQLLFDSERNWERLREYLNSAKLPCIPYLGLYLTDLSFIDAAHGTLKKNCKEYENTDRKKYDILARILHFQKSFYDNLTYVEHLQKYLQSFKVHDELAKFTEDDLFSDTHRAASSSPAVGFLRRTSLSRTLLAISRLRSNLSPFEKAAQSLTPQLSSRRSRGAIISDHRRARSLGIELNTGEVNLSFSSDADSFHSKNVEDRELTMSSISTSVENKTVSAHSPRPINLVSSFLPLKTSTPLRFAPKVSPITRFSSFGRETNTDRYHLIDDDDDDCEIPDYEGEAAFITVRKCGIKSTMMKCNQKCYLELRSSYLYQFCRRSINIRCKSIRDAYYKKASKVMKLDENAWCVTCYINSGEPYFEMRHLSTGRIYRYICKSETDATEWYQHIREAIQNALLRAPAKLISFD
uniref:Ras-GEF domain-containing protein n=1 Tax=Elaeophora elaphi TaxID=1147741 RepID=A0A0R3RZZ9_9BILA